MKNTGIDVKQGLQCYSTECNLLASMQEASTVMGRSRLLWCLDCARKRRDTGTLTITYYNTCMRCGRESNSHPTSLTRQCCCPGIEEGVPCPSNKTRDGHNATCMPCGKTRPCPDIEEGVPCPSNKTRYGHHGTCMPCGNALWED